MATDPSQIIMGLLQTAGLGSTPNSVAQQNVQLRGGQLQNQVQAMQIAGAQAAQQREQAFQRDMQEYGADPTPQRLQRLIAMHPDQAKPIQEAHAALDAPAQQSRVTVLGSIYNAARNNQPALIATQLEKIIAAEKAQGIDTAEPEALRAALASNDPNAVKQALAFSQAQLAIVDPAFAKTMGIGTDQNHFTSTGDGAIYDQRDGSIARAAPPKEPKWHWDEDRGAWVQEPGSAGSMGGGGQGSGAIGGSSPASGSVVDRIITAESGGDPNARSPVPGQSASGLGGFTDKTWVNLYRQRFGARGMSREQILALKSDPTVGRQMVAAAVDENASALARAGLPATDTNIYTMHFLGPRGAAVLKADPSTPVSRLVPPEFIEANPKVLRGKTAGQVRQWAAGKMGGDPNAAAGSMPVAQQGARVGPNGIIYGKPKPGYQVLKPEEVPAGLDPNTIYQRGPDGQITPVGGQRQGQLKAWPAPALNARVSNDASLQNVNAAIRLLDPKNNTPEARAARGAIGFGTGALGSYYTNNIGDPAGTNFRAQIGQIGGVIIKDISGAAVSASEDARLAQWVPKVSDSPETARQKLINLRREIMQRNMVMDQTYSEDQGFRPLHSPQSPGAHPPIPKPGAVVNGYRFKGGDPASPASWVKAK